MEEFGDFDIKGMLNYNYIKVYKLEFFLISQRCKYLWIDVSFLFIISNYFFVFSGLMLESGGQEYEMVS